MQKDARTVTHSISGGKQSDENFFRGCKKLFFSAVKWNFFESISYQLVFIAHQVGLFMYCDRTLYGKMGALFSTAYIGVTILVAGFDGGLLPFFGDIIHTKKSFFLFAVHHVKKQLALMVSVGSLFFVVFFFYFPELFSNTLFLFLSITFIVVEASKKILKQLLYLSFHNRQTALYELAHISSYVATLWSLHWCGIPFSIPLFLLPFIIYSFLFCLLCVRKLYYYYQSLSAEPLPSALLTHTTFFKIRTAVLINQLTRVFFSSNVLVPLFALHSGFREAGLVTFVNYLTHAFTFFIQKTILPSAEAFFAHIKKLSVLIHYQAFFITLSFFAGLTTVLGIVLFTQGKAFLQLASTKTFDHITWNILLFFLFIHVLESMFMLYEKFFLLQNRIYFLTLGNIITCLVCYAIFKLQVPFFTLIGLCIFIRFLFFLVLSLVAYGVKLASR